MPEHETEPLHPPCPECGYDETLEITDDNGRRCPKCETIITDL